MDIGAEDIELKKPTTYEEQVELLKSRNLIIENEFNAIEVLKRINYYRLSAYFLSLKQDEDKELFKDGTTFDQIYRLYEFDTKLRNLLMEQLESIEIAFRTHISYLLAHSYGALGYESSETFFSEDSHAKFMASFKAEIGRQTEIFIKHHLKKYGGKIPIWVAIEVISFSSLSMLYSNMKYTDQKRIAKENYGLHHDSVRNWMHVLSYVRNVCAHFGRIYNKSLAVKPKLYTEDYKKIGNDKIFAALYVMKRLVHSTDEWRNFILNIEALVEKYDDVVELDLIGFPINWIELLSEK